MNYILCSHIFRSNAIEFFQLLISPCPLVGIIILVHPLKLGIDMLQTVNRTRLYAVYQGINLTFGSYQSGNIHPFAATDRCIGLQPGTNLFIVMKTDTFQTFDNRIAKKLVNGYLIKADTFHQSRVAYLGTVKRINIGKFAGGITQIF